MTGNLQSKIVEYHSFRPFQFPVVKSMSLNLGIDPIRGTSDWQEHLTIRFSKDHTLPGDEFELELFGVRELRFEQPLGCPFNLYLEITELPGVDHNGVRFVLHNTEQDVRFSCACHDFMAAIVHESRSGH